MGSWYFCVVLAAGTIKPWPARTRLLLTVLAFVAVFGCAAPPLAFALGGSDWLGRINEVRMASQLPPVADEPAWDTGISAHLEYMMHTPARYEVGPYRSAHTENPASPWYSAAGAKEAESSNLGGGHTNVEAIDNWLAAPFHATGILDPDLKSVAFARDPATGNAGLDVLSGVAVGETAPPQLVLFPGPGFTIDLADYIGESPSPIPTCNAQHPGADYRYPGLPVIAFLTEPPSSDLTATMTMPDGSTISSSTPELCVVTEHNYVSSDPVYGPTGGGTLSSYRAVFIIPREPLVEGAYSVDIAQLGRPDINWSFFSKPRPEAISKKFGLTIRAHRASARIIPVGLGSHLLGRTITVAVTRWWVPCALILHAKTCTWVRKGHPRRLRLHLSKKTVVHFRRPGAWEKVSIDAEGPAMVVDHESYPPSTASTILTGPKPHHAAH